MARKPTYEELEQRVKKLEQEVVKRKQMEKTLETSGKKFRAIVENSPDMIYILDAEGRFGFLGGALESLLGFTTEELTGKHFTSIIWPEDIEKAERHFSERRTGERSTRGFEVRLITRSGTGKYVDIKYLPVELYAFGVYDKPVSAKDKKFLGTYGVARDITDRKQAEEALRVSAKQWRTTFDTISDAVCLIDMEGRILQCNKAMTNLLGKSFEQIIGCTCWELVHGTSEPVEGCPIVRMRKTRRRETLVIETDDQYLKVTADPLLDEDGNLMGGVHIIRDITERKLAEEALKEYSERLEEMVEERTQKLRDVQEQLVRREKLTVLGQLAGGLGHELRNPLGAIKNTVYFLNMALREPEPEVKESLEIIEKEVGISERIINSLLDFARPKPPTQLKVDINDVVRAALSRVPAPENVAVVWQLSETLPTISADADQLAQVFGNLILNAFQAMPEGGQLAVKSEVPSPAECVTVSFTDTGVGMDKETLAKVFEPLFTTKSKGIGLGLALTKMLVQAHGGTIEVQSAVGKGTSFTVKLPVG